MQGGSIRTRLDPLHSEANQNDHTNPPLASDQDHGAKVPERINEMPSTYVPTSQSKAAGIIQYSDHSSAPKSLGQDSTGGYFEVRVLQSETSVLFQEPAGDLYCRVGRRSAQRCKMISALIWAEASTKVPHPSKQSLK